MIVIPMLLIIVYAFTKQGNDVATLQFTLEHFKKFFTDPDFLKTLWLSLRIALMTTVLCADRVSGSICNIPVQQAQSSDSACYIADVDQHAGAYIRMDWYSGR